MIDFEPFPKIPRLRRTVVVTEKIDGTNATIHISESGEMLVGSRNRWITPGDDNHGFAGWVEDRAEELRALGPGWHRGEWYGAKINGNRYGLGDRRFALFNTSRWNEVTPPPACCSVVPVLAIGSMDEAIAEAMAKLAGGSAVAPGCMRPEGIVVYHTASGGLFKVLCEGDEVPKSFRGADAA